MDIITDPFFYSLAIPAIVALGISKGGFAGAGMIATPLLALAVPPLQAAAILLPILLCQDAMSAWVYRRRWSGWNLKVMLPGAVVGVGAAWLFAAPRDGMRVFDRSTGQVLVHIGEWRRGAAVQAPVGGATIDQEARAAIAAVIAALSRLGVFPAN